MDEDKKVFLIHVSKVTSMNGEQVDVTCNFPMAGSDDELKACLRRMTDLIDARMAQVNETVLRDTNKSMREYDDEEQGHFAEDSEEKKIEQPN